MNLERRRWLACGLIVLAVLAAYCNTLSSPFIFDDELSVTGNSTIKHLWPVWRALIPPHGLHDGGWPVAGRPIFNLSLAVNYALGGLAVQGYHVLSLVIHILAALTLFGVVRRTLLRQGYGEQALTSRLTARTFQISDLRSEMLEPTWLALAIALLWALHPLQTESVTYISQRAESLMGLFYLLTIYCFLRSVENRYQVSGIRCQVSGVRSKEKPSEGGSNSALQSFSSSVLWWRLASIFCCLAGMATKEVMVSAPLIVLLYDRTFVAGTFREAWQQRRKFYLSLASTWLLLGCLVASTQGRGGTAGFGTKITWWSYALTQFRAIVHYLRLSLWPDRLVLDYGTTLATRAVDIVPYAVIVLLLAIGTAIALWRRPAIGFLGCWFFAILAPSSSIVPIVTQTMAEHRMYLALAPVVVLVVLGLHRLLGRRSMILFAALAVGLGCVTAKRNQDYKSEMTMWTVTTANCPDNERAFYNLGNVLAKTPNRAPDAIAAYQAALRIKPDYTEAHINLGNTFLNMPGRLSDAIAQYEAVLRFKPDDAEAHNNLGNILLGLPGRWPEAMAHYEAALRVEPDSAETHYNIGNVFRKMPGRLPDAIAQYETALRINPDLAETHTNLGDILLKMPGRLPDAIAHYEAALRLKPNDAEAHNNLGNALLLVPDRLPDAIAEYETALRLKPDYAPAHYNLGNAFFQLNRFTEALGEYESAIQLKPDYAEAHNNLGNALAELGRLPEAIEQYKEALRINPDYVNAQKDLDQVQEAMAAEEKYKVSGDK